MIQYNGPIFLHPPKTAGTSIIAALVQSKIAIVDDSVDFNKFLLYNLHQTFREFGYHADADYAISVRSPYTRYVSLYYQFCWYPKKKYLDAPKDSDKTLMKFKRYLMNTFCHGSLGNHGHPCTHWINGITGKINIIKFENLISDVKNIYSIDLRSFPNNVRRGLGEPQGLGTNYTNTVTEQETIKFILKYYDDSVISIINEIAQSDFTVFGYKKFNNYREMADYAQT